MNHETLKADMIEQTLSTFKQEDIEDAVADAPVELWNKMLYALMHQDRFGLGDALMDMLLASAEKLTPDSEVEDIIEAFDAERREAYNERMYGIRKIA